MRIRDLAREEENGCVRVAATYEFEHCDLPGRRVAVESTGPAKADLEPSADAFLLIGLPLACWMGEARVEIDGVVCSGLRTHLGDAMRLWSHWYERVDPVAIEATEGFCAAQPRSPRRTATLISGGLDSLANLRANRDAYPLEHPEAIREGLFLDRITSHDFDEDLGLQDLARRRNADRIENVHRLGASSDFEVTVLTTSARQLYPDWPSYRDIGWAALILAHAHFLSARFSDVHLSSTGYPLPLPPHGSNPAQDVLYSTAAVRVRHPLPFTDRLSKLALIADWPEGLAALDVCFQVDPPGCTTANCGQCSKCFRTMLGLLALGRLADAPTFPHDDLTPAQVKHMPLDDGLHVSYLVPLLPQLEAVGRTDLVDILRHRIHRWKTRNTLRRRLSRALRRAEPRS